MVGMFSKGESRIVPKQQNDLCAEKTFEEQGDIAIEPVHTLLVW